MRLLERIRTDLEPLATVEQFPKLEGRQMVMLLAPKKSAAAKPHHPDKPEVGKPQGAKAATSPRTERTAVGSK